MADKWNVLPHAGWEQLHADVAERFQRNCVDAELWCESLTLYWDYKAGRLTRMDLGRRLESIKKRFDPEKGTSLIRETYDRFVEEWQRVYDGGRMRRSMEGRYHNPDGEPFLPGLKPE
jgi:hypothetical protein